MNTRSDMPENYYFGGGGVTSITPVALCVLCVAMILLLVLPRRYAIASFLLAGLLLCQGQTVVVVGFHFNAYRLLLLAGWARLLIKRDFGRLRPSRLDRLVLMWALANAIVYSLLWAQTAAVVNRLGFLYTNLGAYFLLRFMIREKEDVLRTIKILIITMIVIAPLMLRERITGHNLFSIVGAPELSDVRLGSIRAAGPFAHAIIAGTVAATLLPLFVGLFWYDRKSWKLPACGIVASLIMTISCASSTPIMTIAAGTLGLSFWRFRKRMQLVRRATVMMLVVMQLCMKAPIWFLLARLGSVMGGSGWHRAMLIDNFVHRFGEWWLLGTRNNADWGLDMWDAVNAFVGEGQSGGLVTFILYVAMFVAAYKIIGVSRKATERSRGDARLIWAIGAALFATTVAFFGIAYFDQSILVWYGLLAMIAATPSFVPAKQKRVATQITASASGHVCRLEPVGPMHLRVK